MPTHHQQLLAARGRGQGISHATPCLWRTSSSITHAPSWSTHIIARRHKNTYSLFIATNTSKKLKCNWLRPPSSHREEHEHVGGILVHGPDVSQELCKKTQWTRELYVGMAHRSCGRGGTADGRRMRQRCGHHHRALHSQRGYAYIDILIRVYPVGSAALLDWASYICKYRHKCIYIYVYDTYYHINIYRERKG